MITKLILGYVYLKVFIPKVVNGHVKQTGRAYKNDYILI
jgi:hypothetical protein